jgi:hypothetical protein
VKWSESDVLPGLDVLVRWVDAQDGATDVARGVADPDAALDARDQSAVRDWWGLEDDAVQALLVRTPLDAEASAGIERLAELAFRRAFAAGGQHHDLAAQVSDDLRLIGEASSVGYSSPALEKLWASYATGAFPVTV